MIFNTLIAFAIVAILVILIGLYYFSKQQYDNSFVSWILDKDKLELLKSNQVNQGSYRKIKFILNVRTAIYVVLVITLISVFNTDNTVFRYLVIVLLFVNTVISNKLLETALYKRHI